MSKKKLFMIVLIMIGLSIFVSVLSIYGTLQLKQSQWFSSSNTNAPSYHSLDKVIISVKGKRQTHYVMMEIAIENNDPEKMKEIDNYMPVIRNTLLKMFSEKTYEQLQEESDIDKLQKELKSTLLQELSEQSFVSNIKNVLLTKYVIQ